MGSNRRIECSTNPAVLSEELGARRFAQSAQESGTAKYDSEIGNSFREAVRTNRQLATALRDQGLNEVADRFSYRAQLLRRDLLWWTLRRRLRAAPHRGLVAGLWGWVAWSVVVLLWLTTHVTIQHWQTAIASLLAIMTLTLVATGTTRPIRPMIKTGFSLLTSVALWALAGYGYRPGRAILAWALVVLAGTIAFYAADRGVGWHGVWGALIESISACHGRGVFYLVKGQTSASFAQGTIASILAVCGLIIEATFIATFTQRFFGR